MTGLVNPRRNQKTLLQSTKITRKSKRRSQRAMAKNDTHRGRARSEGLLAGKRQPKRSRPKKPRAERTPVRGTPVRGTQPGRSQVRAGRLAKGSKTLDSGILTQEKRFESGDSNIPSKPAPLRKMIFETIKKLKLENARSLKFLQEQFISVLSSAREQRRRCADLTSGRLPNDTWYHFTCGPCGSEHLTFPKLVKHMDREHKRTPKKKPNETEATNSFVAPLEKNQSPATPTSTTKGEKGQE